MAFLPGRLDSGRAFRLGAIALAAGAAASWSGNAYAFVVGSSDLITQTFDLPLTDTEQDVILDGGFPSGSAQFGFVTNDIFLHDTAGVVGGIACYPYIGCGPKASLLSPGDVVGPSSNFLTGDGDEYYFDGPGTVYLGLSFDVSGTDPYGYATIVNGELISITYDANGNPVTIRAPEPSALGLLALGAAGVVALRRRRAARS